MANPTYEQMKKIDPDYTGDLDEMSPEEKLKAMGYEVEEEEENKEEEKEKEKEEEKESEEEEDEKEPIQIPKARFDEAVRKERERREEWEDKFKEQSERTQWLEEQLTELIKDKKPVENKEKETVFDFDEAEEKVIEHIIAGEDKEAAKLRTQINRERDKIYSERISELEEKLLNKTTESYKKLSDEDKLNIVLENAVNKYEILDQNKEDYDVDVANEVDALASGYEIRRGISKAEAYQKAIERVMKRYQKEEKKSDTLTGRKKKKIENMEKQPPKTEGKKNIKDIDLDNIDIAKLSDEEFAKLSDSDIKYLLNK